MLWSQTDQESAHQQFLAQTWHKHGRTHHLCVGCSEAMERTSTMKAEIDERLLMQMHVCEGKKMHQYWVL